MAIFVMRDGKIVEKSRAAPSKNIGVISDVQPFQSPIDKTWITSRSQIREHEKKHSVYQIGNDWCGREKPPFWDSLKLK
jgi:hypothetical protein